MDTRLISAAERERLMSYLAVTRERLLRTARSLSHEQLDFQPAPDRWSVAQNLEHIIIVENLVLGRIEGARQEPPGSKPGAWEGRDEALIADIERRNPRFRAPEFAQPTGQWQHEELFRQFEAARQRTAELAALTNAALRHHLFSHPVYADLDCYQWLLAEEPIPSDTVPKAKR